MLIIALGGLGISFAVYKLSQWFLVSGKNIVGYLTLAVCIAIALYFGSFAWWWNLAIGVALYLGLSAFLGALCSRYINHPIVTHSVVSLVAVVGFLAY